MVHVGEGGRERGREERRVVMRRSRERNMWIQTQQSEVKEAGEENRPQATGVWRAPQE